MDPGKIHNEAILLRNASTDAQELLELQCTVSVIFEARLKRRGSSGPAAAGRDEGA
jgi:hypothetical protein